MADTYALLDEVKDALRIPATDTHDDLTIESCISSSSRAIDQFCDRYFGQTGTQAVPVQRLYRAVDRRVLIDDLVTLTDVEVDYTGYAENFTSLGASSVLTQPVNAGTMVPAWPFTQLLAKPRTVLPPAPGWIRVSGVFGWPAVPSQVRDACILNASKLFKSRDIPLGLQSAGDGLGTIVIPSAGLHPDARMLCEPFRRYGLV